ncbi:entericidin, EcnA/B family [Neotabrizicola sp. VNH66]
MRPTLIRFTLSAAALALLAACNTVAGVGADMQNAGAAVSTEARKAEAGM